MARYVVVTDTPSKTIIGGAYLWDGETLWEPPEGGGRGAQDMVESGELLLEDAAVATGYRWPPPPADEWVACDPATMLITAGPAMWNGEGDPPITGEVLMRRSEAESSGYSWP